LTTNIGVLTNKGRLCNNKARLLGQDLFGLVLTRRENDSKNFPARTSGSTFLIAETTQKGTLAIQGTRVSLHSKATKENHP
jgi:hypothetical protein